MKGRKEEEESRGRQEDRKGRREGLQPKTSKSLIAALGSWSHASWPKFSSHTALRQALSAGLGSASHFEWHPASGCYPRGGCAFFVNDATPGPSRVPGRAGVCRPRSQFLIIRVPGRALRFLAAAVSSKVNFPQVLGAISDGVCSGNAN